LGGGGAGDGGSQSKHSMQSLRVCARAPCAKSREPGKEPSLSLSSVLSLKGTPPASRPLATYSLSGLSHPAPVRRRLNGVTVCEVARSAGALDSEMGAPNVVTMLHVGSCTRATPAVVGAPGHTHIARGGASQRGSRWHRTTTPSYEHGQETCAATVGGRGAAMSRITTRLGLTRLRRMRTAVTEPTVCARFTLPTIILMTRREWVQLRSERCGALYRVWCRLIRGPPSHGPNGGTPAMGQMARVGCDV
jgi:hypothetical protein